jgi:hypothetical protein
MANELMMVIADAQARVLEQYGIDIGPRGVVELASEVFEAVEDHLANAQFDPEIPVGDVFADLDDLKAPDPDFDADAYDAGYKAGRELAEKSPIEIFSAVSEREQFLADHSEMRNEYFDSGLRDALLHASN